MTETLTNGIVENGMSNEAPKTVVPKAKLAEIKITDYIRAALDKVALSEGFKNYEIVVDHGSGIGDGFVGVILKITIKEKNSPKVLSVLAKIPPDSKVKREEMKLMQVFEREVLMYNVILPAFVKMQEEKNVSKSMGFFNFPKVYYADFNKEKDDSIIIMEDLRDSGHKMWSKFEPINFEHAKMLLTSIGRLHALSFALKIHNPELFHEVMNLNDLFAESFSDDSFKLYLEGAVNRTVNSLDPTDEKRKTRASKLINNTISIAVEPSNKDNFGPYGVLVHGDCWINNYLFHYSKPGLPNDVVLIDWQTSRYGSPVIDLMYFIFICTDQKLRAKHFDELLNIYHRSLKELLDHLGGDTMTQFPFTALLRHLRKFGKYGVLMSSLIVPMLQTKSEDIPDMDFTIESMKSQDPEVIAAMMQQFIQEDAVKAIEERLRGVLHDAIKYGYL
jgi:Ecdysteroid kinase-like family